MACSTTNKFTGYNVLIRTVTVTKTTTIIIKVKITTTATKKIVLNILCE